MRLAQVFLLISAVWNYVAIAAYGQSRVVIKGPSNFAYRLEIHDFVKNKQFFTLYVRALQNLQSDTESDDSSYFGVGGIHGLPYVTWNGATGSFVGNDNPDWTFGGYCTHGAEIFPTWHRPYVSLYEQLLQSQATKIASKFTVNKAVWANAALQFRQPYWDWAQYALPPDEVIRDATVTITDYNGKSVSVTNPLMRYKFQAKLPLSYFANTSYANWQTTLRHPNSKGKENINEMVNTLNMGHNQTRTDTVLLLTNVHDWDGFSNHDSSENAITNSLESIHDNIHVEVGGNGHMADPAVAAFDPIFFLHHTQVDRIIELWTIMNPDVWVVSGPAPIGGTYTLSPDATIDNNTDLTPFWDSQTTFWKSSELTSTTKLGYAYADFQGVDLNNPAAKKKKVTQIIQQYMQGGGSSAFSAVARRDSTNSSQIPNWSVNVRSQPHEVGRPYSVLFFIGEVPDDSTQWHNAPTLVGTENAFVNSAPHYSGNSSPTRGLSESIMHLNGYISARHPELGSFDETVIKPFLQQKLSWKAVDMSGTPLNLTSLQVNVFSVPLTWDVGSDFPTAGKIQYHPDITQGKAGGSSSQ